MNERIRAREIRVIDDDGGQLGIMTPREALLIARERGIDLIEVAPQAQPPVCKIMDYGKYKYEQAKKEKESAKKHKQSELKDIRLDPRYGTLSEHDLMTKVNHARKFLEDGDKVKVTFRFIGGQIRHPEIGRQQLETFMQKVADVAAIEKPPTMEGRSMSLTLTPAKGGGAAPKPAAPKPAAPKAPAVPAAAPTVTAPEPIAKPVTPEPVPSEPEAPPADQAS
ncbi:MAG: translation initiation factor IF-3 [Janthinobacterium lividum]